jgi:hypothetical protein
MTFQNIFINLAALLAFSPAVMGFTTPCTFQEYKCGYAMVADDGIYILALNYSIQSY